MDKTHPEGHTHTKETFKLVKKKTEDGKSLINQYKVLDRLGQGPFSVIKLVEDQETKKLYAAKTYNKNILQKNRELVRGKDGKVQYKDQLQDILNEIKIMKKLDHPNVIKLWEVINDPDHHKIYMIIDYCEKGCLVDWDDETLTFKSKTKDQYLPEEEIARMIGQIIKGLDYLHSNHIAHRDLKPQNMLQTQDGIIKLADFDVAAEIHKGVTLNKTKGTFHFMAPEICKKNPKLEDSYIGYTSDIWSLGISLYCLTYMKLPFFDPNLIGLIEAIESKSHMHKTKERPASDDLKDLIDKMLEKDPKKRITLNHIKEHAFFKKHNFSFKET